MGYLWSPPDLFGHRTVEGFGDAELEVRPIEKSRADEIIRAGHYSKSVVWSSSEHFGVFHNKRLCGALQFGPGMNPASGSKVVADSSSDSWLELNRMWLDDAKPANCASRAVAFSIRILRKIRPRLEWVQSFADERCGKLGSVYQACSFLYLGSHEATFYELDGEWFHKSMWNRPTIDKRGWGCGPKITRLLANKARAVRHTFVQYRYFRPLNRNVLARLRLPVLPYPKADVHRIDCDMGEDCSCDLARRVRGQIVEVR